LPIVDSRRRIEAHERGLLRDAHPIGILPLATGNWKKARDG
jgi:hypothetical protein